MAWSKPLRCYILGMDANEVLMMWSTIAQGVAGLGAVASAIIALVIASKDRAEAARLAKESADLQFRLASSERAFRVEHDRLSAERDALLRLAENLARGGSTDPLETAQMGAEALAIVGMIGPEKLPLYWAERVEMGDEEMMKFAAEDDTPEWVRWSIEAKVALSRTLQELVELRDAQR